MPDFSILKTLADPNLDKIIGTLPNSNNQPQSSGGDDLSGLGGLLKGLGGLLGKGVSNPQTNVNPQPQANLGLLGASQKGIGMNPQTPDYQSPQAAQVQQAFDSPYHPNLNGLNPDLVSRTNAMMADLKQQGYQPVIAEGMRTQEQQAEKVRLGNSHTMNSNHLNGSAVDIVDARYGWNDKKYGKEINGYAQAMAKTAQKYGLFSGTQWKSFGPNGDFAHVQLPNGKTVAVNPHQQSAYNGVSMPGNTDDLVLRHSPSQPQAIPNYNPNQPRQMQNLSIQNQSPELNHVMKGIASVETPDSKDPYSEVGKMTRRGDQALGKYQIMSSNVPAWSREALGHPVTRDQFLKDPAIQEKVAAFQINKYLQSGHSPQDAASMWFTGRPLGKVNMNVKDAYGTTNTMYQKKFNQGYLRSKAQTSAIGPLSSNSQVIQPTPSTGGQSPPQYPPQILDQIRQEADQGKDLEG